MDTVLLPIIEPKARLTDAIELLRKGNSMALATKSPAGFKVIDVDLILHGLRERGDIRVISVKPRLACLTLEGGRPANRLSRAALLRAQDLMDKRSAAFAVTRMVRGRAELLTRHETYGYLLGGTPDMWRCTTDSRHVWLTSDLIQPGNRCREDGSNVVAI